jgi:hypothetical protein
MAVNSAWVRPAGAGILIVSLVALGACRDVEPTTAGGAQGELGLVIEEPEDGATVEGEVDVAVSVEGTEIGAPETGLMHFHLYVGDSGQYEVVTETETTVSVPKGEQTLRAVLAQPNHQETEVSDEATVTVAGAGGGETDTDTGGGGYGDYGGG